MKPLTKREQQRLVNAARQKRQEDVRLVRTLLETGISATEWGALSDDMVHGVHVGQHFLNLPRVVPISDGLYQEIASELLVSYHGARKGRMPFGAREAQKRLRLIGELAGLGRVTPGRLRLTYAVNQRKAGVDLDVLTKRLGFKSIDWTRKYVGEA